MAESSHPLMAKQHLYPRSWKEWRERWDTTQNWDDLIGLLHSGFNTTCESRGECKPIVELDDEQVERLCFYLELADHWQQDNHFKVRSNHPGDKQPDAEQRKLLAEKAFKMICLKLFAEMKKAEDRPRIGWEWNLILRNKLIWFFRPDDETSYRRGDLLNLPSSSGKFAHEHELMLGAGLTLARRLWLEKVEVGGAVLRAWAPQVVKLAYGLGQLEALFSGQRSDSFRPPDILTLLAIRELAMGHECFLPSRYKRDRESRLPDSLEEACLANFGTARAATMLLQLMAQLKAEAILSRKRARHHKAEALRAEATRILAKC